MTKLTSTDCFHPVTQSWFEGAFEQATKAQTLAWKPICAGQSTLLLAPTGSGKTLAAFLSAIDRLLFTKKPDHPGVRVLYISPLKALAVDVERNLRSPLVGIQALAMRQEVPHNPPVVAVRSGDTPQSERAKMARKPPDILITTPESLYLVMTSKARSMLEHVETIIIDEIHTMVSSKRGTHLMLTLERIEAMREHTLPPLQRIGLSATQRPLTEVAQFLGGYQIQGERSNPRKVSIVDAGEQKKLKLSVEMPAEEMIEQNPDELDYGVSSDGVVRSSWANLTPRIVELIQANRSTIIFVNSRRSAEKLAAAINEKAGILLARAHHGSLAHNIRTESEEQLKMGHLPAIVATASLELGIDMGAVELVIQVGAFPSVSSGLQRIGRSRHHVGGIPEGVSFPKHDSDLLASAVVQKAMLTGQIEASSYPRNPLDVLAQQIAAMIAMNDWPLQDIYSVVRRCAAYRDLSQDAFEGVLDMMSGRYPADDFSDLRPTIVWDRVQDHLSARKGLQRLAVINGGTIAERGLYGVFLYNGGEEGSKRVGELDEEMVFESRVGDVFLLGASSWRIEEITSDRVLVTPAPGVPGKMPFWKGDQMGRSYDLGTQIGQFCREFKPERRTLIEAKWEKEHGLADNAIEKLWDFMNEQVDAGGMPTDRKIIIERFMDEIGDWRICILSPFGSAVHAPWAMAVRAMLMVNRGIEVDVMWSDDGMVFRVSEGEQDIPATMFTPQPDATEDILMQRLSETPFFGARFRENAGRSLLLPKKRPGKRSPLWALRRRAASLLKVASEFRDFPIVLETYRECLVDHFDMTNLKSILSAIQSRQIRVEEIQSDVPSPFASSLMFQYVANFIYDGDAPLAERRAQALTIDQSKLRELMGEAALRSLLDIDSIQEVVDLLQRKTHPASGVDGLHSLLLELGPMTRSAIEERMSEPDKWSDWLEPLLATHRIFCFKVDGGHKYAASEDAARLRDALGIVIPVGVPLAFQEPANRPLRDLVRRYGRTHGPFTVNELINELGLPAGILLTQLDQLEKEGQLIAGAFKPSGTEPEWCDADVLRRIKRKALSKLRAQVEAVEPEKYTAFLMDWHQIDGQLDPRSLIDVVEQIQGYSLPSRILEHEVIPARMASYVEGGLDALCASGQAVWIGDGGAGTDIRIKLYLRAHVSLLHQANPPLSDSMSVKIRELLRERGGLFFEDIKRALKVFPLTLVDGLWAMVRNGELSNDTLLPLRTLRREPRKSKFNNRRRRRMTPQRDRIKGTEGRWWLVESCIHDDAEETGKAVARCQMMMERYGILCREAFGAEKMTGGFSRYYPVLKALEERGKVRRGFYVDTLGATQFAMPGLEARLRQNEHQHAPVWISVLDPAQPHGSILNWPKDFPIKPTRSKGALIYMTHGEAIAVLLADRVRILVREPEDEAKFKWICQEMITALKSLPKQLKQRTVHIEKINGRKVSDFKGHDQFVRAGIASSSTGLQIRLTSAEYAMKTNEAPVEGQRY